MIEIKKISVEMISFVKWKKLKKNDFLLETVHFLLLIFLIFIESIQKMIENNNESWNQQEKRNY